MALRLNRTATACLLAAALAAVFATHVYTSFHQVRARVVVAPQDAASGEVHVAIARADNDETLSSLKVPFAVIWRSRNNAPQPVTLSIAIDGHPLCNRRVEPGHSDRNYCVIVTEGLGAEPGAP